MAFSYDPYDYVIKICLVFDKNCMACSYDPYDYVIKNMNKLYINYKTYKNRMFLFCKFVNFL